MSIDPRTATTPDQRGSFTYEDNTTEHMLQRLGAIPGADLDKLTAFDATTDVLAPVDLPVRPNYCFIDGEHTHEAVVRDTRFCAEALGGEGVIAFHDYVIVGSAISTFLRENWEEISFAVAFSANLGGGVFALEIGGRGFLKHPAVRQAIGSRWHRGVWTAANRSRHTVLPFLTAWAVIPAIDSFVAQARHGFREYVRC